MGSDYVIFGFRAFVEGSTEYKIYMANAKTRCEGNVNI